MTTTSAPGHARRSLPAALLLLVLGVAPTLGAQRPAGADSARRAPPDSLSADSLAARLARAEAAIALLREQLGQESESGVRTTSRLHLELSARVLTNAFSTSGRVNLTDVPQVVLPPSPDGTAETGGSVGISLRQTRLGLALLVNDVFGGAFAADLDVDFFGGAQYGPGDRQLFPEPRLRTARARLVLRRTELMVGAETPLVSGLDPVSVASVGAPDFSGAGNLWNWLPQLRVTQELGASGGGASRLQWALQGALLEPWAGGEQPGEPDAVDAGERSRLPFVEGRLRARWGAAAAEHDLPAPDDLLTHGGEVGIGVHRGWVSVRDDSRASSRAFTADARVGLAGVELRGEGYVGGRLLRGLGGGAIAQAFGRPAAGAPADVPGPPLRDAAGWVQLNAKPHPVLVAGVGCGTDVVEPVDRPLRERNDVCATHILWRPVRPILAGAEFRWLRTRYAEGAYRAHHINLAFGVEF